MTKFSRRLIRLRKVLGVSQNKFARMVKISQPSVSGYEAGRFQPGAKNLKKLTKIALSKGITLF